MLENSDERHKQAPRRPCVLKIAHFKCLLHFKNFILFSKNISLNLLLLNVLIILL